MESITRILYKKAIIVTFCEHFWKQTKLQCNRCRNNLRCNDKLHGISFRRGHYQSFTEFVDKEVRMLNQRDIMRNFKILHAGFQSLTIREAQDEIRKGLMREKLLSWPFWLYDAVEFRVTGRLASSDDDCGEYEDTSDLL